MCGGKIVTKNFIYEVPNSHANKYGVSRYFSSRPNTIRPMYYISNAQYIFEPGKQVKSELEKVK